jgi:hypothetical protein
MRAGTRSHGSSWRATRPSLGLGPRTIPRLGASEFLTTPFSDTVLFEVVRRLARRSGLGATVPFFPLPRSAAQ